MKLKQRALSLLLVLAMVFGFLPTVMPTVAKAAAADTPEGVRNHLPSTATNVRYLSEMNWEYSINDALPTDPEPTAVKNYAWNTTDGAIILGNTAENGGTTFAKGLGVMPKGENGADVSYTVFDLADNDYAQDFFYSAVGITNRAADDLDTGVVFEVWASYDKSVEDHTQAQYTLLESSGDPAKNTHVTKGYVYQFHLDVKDVRYLKLVVYSVGDNTSLDSAWAGACVYNNTGYYPKSDLMGLNNGKDNATWVPTGTSRFHTYHFNNIPSDAVYLSGTDYKDATTYTPVTENGKVVEFQSNSEALGELKYWLGGVADMLSLSEETNLRDGILVSDTTKYLRFNCRKPGESNNVTDGWITFDISNVEGNRFYTAIGIANNSAKHTAYNPENGTYGGVVCQVWGAAAQEDEYTLLSESEPIMLSQTGEFLVDIEGYNFLKLRVQAKDTRSISGLDVMFFSPCVFDAWDVAVSGNSSVLLGLNASYKAVVRQDLAENSNYTGAVTWTLSGQEAQGTTLVNGKLTVAADETADELTITATIQEGGKTITSDPITVNVVKSADGVRNHLPSIAKDVVYLSNMTWEKCVNNEGKATTKNYAWNDSTAPIVLGDIAANGGTTFMKGLGVMPKGTDANDASYTVFDLADNDYKQSFFYSAAGITNNTAKNSKSKTDVKNGVIFAVYGSYDKNEANYENAKYVLLEKSDKLTKGLVHQFHLDVTGVRYLKLVVYAVDSISYMNSAWAGACVYNNPGYQPKTDMFGSCNGDEGKYVAPKNPTMFNIYQFPNLPADAVILAQQTASETVVHTEVDRSSFGTNAGWVGGTHLPVKDKAGVTQEKNWQKDGIKFPAKSTLYFNACKNDISDGYVVYDVSEYGKDTFYCIVGAVNQTYKWSEYDPGTGDFGGMGFEVWANYEEGGEYTQLAESEPILKSNTGEFLLDITDVHSLKLRIRAKDSKSHGYLTGGFAYASVFDEWGIKASGATSVVKGMTADYTAIVRQDLTIDNDYTGDYAGAVTWNVTGVDGATINSAGLLTVPTAAEVGSKLTITASITPEEGETFTSAPITVTVTSVPAGVRNHLPSTAKDKVYLSDMDWEYSINRNNIETIRDGQYTNGNPIVLGATSEANGGTKFTKGLGVMPNETTGAFISNTVFDLADNDYAQSFFYSAAGITNASGMTYAAGETMSNGKVLDGEGVIFEVWASYDKSEDNYASANYELLESSDKITKGLVHQFHLDVTGVRYLKLVTKAVGKVGYMNSAWAGACVYNNPGYYPKTAMISDCNGESAKYVTPADPTMFNTYHFENLPDDAVTLPGQTWAEAVAHSTPSTGVCWVGGTHLPVTDASGTLQDYKYIKDGIKVPTGKLVRFNVRAPGVSNNATDGYVVYDVSKLGMDTFYCIVGSVNDTYKYSEYTPSNGAFGGLVFEVWGTYEDSSEYQLLSESEPILKSNTGEFLVDITGVQSLKLRIRAKDPRTHSSATGIFAYASVYKEDWTVTASGEDAVLQGMKADYTADVTRKLIPGDYYRYIGDIAWAVDGGVDGTTINENGKLTVDSYETASSVQVTASIQEGGKTVTSAPFEVNIVSTGDNVAYVEQTGYTTLAGAVADAAGKTVVMVKDVAQDAPVELDATMEWNLNGKTVSGDTVMNLGENAKLNIVGDGGSLDGKLKLTESGAEITADTAIALEINDCNATVNGKNVTLTDSGTEDGTEGGKIYGSFTADTVSQNGDVRYVILGGEDDTGAYKTANAVRVKLTKVSIRPSAAGMYYTAQMKFNKNVVNAGATYGVVLSTYDEIGENFMREMNSEKSLVNLYTIGTPTPDENFIGTGNSCLVKNILSSTADATANATRGATDIYANAYVKLTVDGEELTFMAENKQPVVYSLKTVMQGFDAKLGAGTLGTLKETVVNFYKSWKDVMADWELANIAKA